MADVNARGKSWREPSTGMEFVWIPGGCFQMGSPSGEKGRDGDEGPVHEVCVDGFYMGKYEVTNRQYRRYDSAHDSGDYKGVSFNSDNQPVVEVSWEDAGKYAKWLSQQAGKAVRLPTEAEWEYAARAGTTTARYWGDNPDAACGYANVYDQTAKGKWPNDESEGHNCDDGYAGTLPVGSFKPNRFGLYDMIGNVSELVEDWYLYAAGWLPFMGDVTYYNDSPRRNPQGSSNGAGRVCRGGSWISYPAGARAASRDWKGPRSDIYQSVGFRLVMSLGPVK